MFAPELVQQTSRSAEPAAGLGDVAAIGEVESEPEGAAGGRGAVLLQQACLVGLLRGVDELLGETEQVRGEREAPEVGGRQRTGVVRCPQGVVGELPRSLFEGASAPIQMDGVGCHGTPG